MRSSNITESPSNPETDSYDPAFLHARREALIVLAVWIVGLMWTVGYCLATGYNVPPEQIRTTLGMPNWIFWGVLIPWILIIVFSIWFGLFFIADEKYLQKQNKSEQEHLQPSQPRMDIRPQND